MQESSLAKIPQVDIRLELDDAPTRKEIKKATRQLKVGKSPGTDGILGEKQCLISFRIYSPLVWRKGLYCSTSGMQSLFLYKINGEKSGCSNCQGITVLSIAGKILARVLLNRLILKIAQENMPESQCGFRSNRGT